jgi:hypothetical protein
MLAREIEKTTNNAIRLPGMYSPRDIRPWHLPQPYGFAGILSDPD